MVDSSMIGRCLPDARLGSPFEVGPIGDDRTSCSFRTTVRSSSAQSAAVISASESWVASSAILLRVDDVMMAFGRIQHQVRMAGAGPQGQCCNDAAATAVLGVRNGPTISISAAAR